MGINEKKRMARKTGLNLKQITLWLINVRRVRNDSVMHVATTAEAESRMGGCAYRRVSDEKSFGRSGSQQFEYLVPKPR